MMVHIIRQNQTMLRARRKRIESLILVRRRSVPVDVFPSLFVDEAELCGRDADDGAVARVHVFDDPRFAAGEVEP